MRGFYLEHPLRKHIALAALLLACLLPSLAFSQTTPKWNERTLTVTPAATCSDGSPLSDCPITDYRIETAASCTAIVWELVTEIPATQLTYRVTGLTAGPHCYRGKSKYGGLYTVAGAIVPASLATVTPPAPNPPGVTTSDVVAYEYKPTTKTFAFVGYAPKGSQCGPQLMVMSAGTYCRLDFERVDKVTKPTRAPIDLWARTAG